MLKFLHAADVHLDSPFRGLERYDGAPVERMRQATRRALENLVDLALDERVQFVLLAGDLYDGDWRDYKTGLFFVRQMYRLREADIRVYLIAGNHDAANRMTRDLHLPDNVHRFPTDRPDTFVDESLGVAVHGQGFARAAVLDDLAANYPHAKRGYFNIGLLHTGMGGREGHEPYAPCTLDGLEVKRYDYWALGHVHQREVVCDRPAVVFPGNLQGRHVREAGPRGCMLVVVRDGRQVEMEFRPLDVVRWERCEVDATGLGHPDDVVEGVSTRLGELRRSCDGRFLAARVVVRGQSEAHESLLANPQRWVNEIRVRANETAADDVWVEKVQLQTTRPTTASSPAADGAVAELRALLEELSRDDSQLLTLAGELAGLEKKLPAELREGDEPVRPGDPAWLRGVLDRAGPLLMARLMGGGPDA